MVCARRCRVEVLFEGSLTQPKCDMFTLIEEPKTDLVLGHIDLQRIWGRGEVWQKYLVHKLWNVF